MDLNNFDPATMTYLASHMQRPDVGVHADPYQEMLLPTDYGENRSAFSGFPGHDDVNVHGMSAPAPPAKAFSTAYEDPFSDAVSAFDQSIHPDQAEAEAPSIDRDNKLLSFSAPRLEYSLLDYAMRPATISVTAQLHGMFFLAESPWASAGDAQAPPSELTCYRRNLFQVTGEVTIPRMLRCLLTERGEQVLIVSQELVISATESTEANAVKIISVPWKTPANPNVPVVEDKVEREPPPVTLNLMNEQEPASDFAHLPFHWKRLQFRIATANNGRRKELQQHFVVRLKVMANLANGGRVPLCEVQSGAIIVRGRSPRNFQSRKDLPLNGSSHVRKTANAASQPARTSSKDGAKQPHDAPTSAPIKTEPGPAAPSVMSMYDATEDQRPTAKDNFEWLHALGGQPPPPAHDAMTTTPVRNRRVHDMNSGYPLSSPDLSHFARPAATSSAPINLSLVEDEPHRPASSNTPPDLRSVKKLHIPPRPPSFTINTINSPDESADLLYEYFPLGLDDWMPPVDAVYRPHVVHHTKLPSDPRDPNTNAKSARSKRYFSEDVS